MDELVVIWASGDKEIATKMLFMYAGNAMKHGWWESIELIVWGPSAKLLSEDEELQQKIKEMILQGIQVEACKACSDSYGVSEVLENLGIEVRYLGKTLTEYLKSGKKILNF